jgi:hypothetical protein
MRILKIPSALFVLTTGATALFAQWPSYSTPGPRTTDGKIDYAAPAPRTANGKPDFSGLWEPVHTKTTGPGAGLNGTAPLPFAIPTTPDDPPVAQFFNIGAGFKDGLLPFTPWGTQVRAQRKGNDNKDNPDALCLPLGLTQLHMHPQPREIVQTPREIVVLYEANGNVRRILTDGRPLPNKDNLSPWWYGYSVAHWDGDTLVVETTGFRDDVWLDVEGSPLTNTGKMTERFRRVNYGNLEIEVTVEDPKAYTHPWTVMIKQRVMLNTDLIEFICNENEKSDAHLVGK